MRHDCMELALAVTLVGCVGAPEMPGMAVATQCTSSTGITIQLESVPSGTFRLCEWSALMVDGLRARYEERWGALALDGWTVRIRQAATFSGDHLGTTWHETRTIDLVGGQWIVFPHELNHVRMGSGHDGWCAEFWPWEETEFGFDERGYLGCR